MRPKERLPRALVWTLMVSAFLLLLLQVWRPYYFLTDDTLSQFLPVLHEMGVNLREGRTFWISRWLFEGDYNLLRDPTLLCTFHPLLLLYAALTARTPAFWFMAEWMGSLQLLLASSGFCLLALRGRDRGWMKAGDGAVAFLSVSFAFTVYNLWFGPSWFNFTGASMILPWLLWAADDASERRSLMVISLVTLHALFSVHVQLVFYSFVFGGLYLLVLVNWRGLRRLVLGGMLGTLPVTPLLWENLQGYLGSERHALSATGEMLQGKLSPVEMAVSFFSGAWRFWRGDEVVWFCTHSAHVFSIALTASGFLFLAASLRWRVRLTRPDAATLAGLGAVLLLIWRPEPVRSLIAALPVVNGFSSPFREVFLSLFFAHLWVLVRFPWENKKLSLLLGVMGVILFVGSTVPYGAPAISQMKLDRELVLDGRAERWWEKQKAEHPDGIFIPVARPEDLVPDGSVPFSLLGSHCYPCLYEFKSASGYSRTQVGGRGAGARGAKRWLWYGVYLPEDAAALEASDSRYLSIEARQFHEPDSRGSQVVKGLP